MLSNRQDTYCHTDYTDYTDFLFVLRTPNLTTTYTTYTTSNGDTVAKGQVVLVVHVVVNSKFVVVNSKLLS